MREILDSYINDLKKLHKENNPSSDDTTIEYNELAYKRMLLNCQFYAHMEAFKVYQEQYGLFLDLEDEDAKKKYWENYPNGTDQLDFLFMICSMTKDKDILKNKVVRKQIKLLKIIRYIKVYKMKFRKALLKKLKEPPVQKIYKFITTKDIKDGSNGQ